LSEIYIKDVVNEFIEKRKLETRFETLVKVLKSYNIPFRVESNEEVKNVIINLTKDGNKKTVIGAHYDVFGSSLGINDNTCAIAMLIKYANDCLHGVKENNIEIVFFDKEESGGRGSADYVRRHKLDIKEALLFDIIGYGEELVASGGMSKITQMFLKHDVKILRYALPSDNIAFIRENIPVTLITAAPITDLIDNGDYTHQVKPQADFYKTFHNQSLDNNIDIINFETIDRAYKMLKEVYVPISV